MNPKAVEALQKAKALFRHPAETDDIPEQITQAPEPNRKPRVVLLPPNAPKFDQHSMKEEHKKMEQPKQTDKYVDMSVREAINACLAKGITKPADIAKETGKPAKQIYTQLWIIKNAKKKARAQARAERQQNIPTPLQQADEWNRIAQAMPTAKQVMDEFEREPTAYEDRNYVVLKNREQYEQETFELQDRIGQLLIENQELKTIIKYLERKASNV